ncbi:acetyl-CoA synthetase-like protein [Dentipellis sp. KUC8613]|nr:acetyl-CoA synthetase-like protein [Dentipellis sp. KUC8613]
MPQLKSLYPTIPHVQATNFYDFLFGLPAVKDLSDFTLYIDGLTGETRRFRAFVDRVSECSSALASSEVSGGLDIKFGRQELVGIFSENCLEYPTIVFALLKLAVPFALLPAYSTTAEFLSLLRLSKVTRLFVSPALIRIARVAAREAGFSEDRIYILQGDVQGFKNVGNLIEGTRSTTRKEPVPPSIGDNDLAYLSFSSGTSGLPKAVMISHRNLISSFLQTMIIGREYAKVAKPRPLQTPEGTRVVFGFLPFYHVTAFHLSILRIFTPPTTVIVLPRWNLDKVLDLITKYRVTHLGLVPSMAHQLVNSPRLATTDLSSIISFGTGAAHLPTEERQKLIKYMPNVGPFAGGYGMTECTVSAMVSPLPGLFDGHFSRDALLSMTGILNPSVEARIIRDDGSDAEYDEPGELLLRGPNIALGYWRNENATAESFLADGWLRTGDRFRVEPTGAFYYVDRIKDTLKVSGTQVSPSEIEHVLLQHPEKLITDVSVAGVPGTRFSDEKVPRAWVVLSTAGQRRGEEASLAALDDWVRSQMAKHKWLRGGIQAVDQIPKSPTGKVLRRVLQEEYQREASAVGEKAKL